MDIFTVRSRQQNGLAALTACLRLWCSVQIARRRFAAVVLKPLPETLKRWLLAVGCFATVIFFFSPSWAAFRLWQRVPAMQGLIEVRRGASVLQQVAHPGAPIEDPLHQAIQWRLFFPFVGKLLSLPTPVLFGLADLGCVLTLGFIITLLRSEGLRWAETALIALLLGAASWVFTSTGWLGYFDSWLALGLLLVAFADSRWIVWLACVFGPWIDERFVIAAPLAVLCRYLWTKENPKPPRSFDWRFHAAVPGLLLGLFVIVRLGLLPNQSTSGATLSGYFGDHHYLDAPLSRILLGVWEGLRGGWILVIAGALLLRRRPARSWIFTTVVLVIVIIGLATAQDYSRSMSMALPAAVLGALLAAKTPPLWLPRTLRIGALAALLLPAHHVMNDLVNPIYYLYHELAAIDNPPAVAMSETYELRAIHAMERGDLGPAETNLTLAIELAADPTSALKQRALLYASQRRWPDAYRDLTALADRDSPDPDAWFLRAQVNLAMGQNSAAISDFEHARSLAPGNWINRPDVARFAANLNRARSNP